MEDYVKWYESQDFYVRLIFAIISVTGWVNAFLYRFGKGYKTSAILAIFFGPVFYIADLISIIMHKEIKWLLF